MDWIGLERKVKANKRTKGSKMKIKFHNSYFSCTYLSNKAIKK